MIKLVVVNLGKAGKVVTFIRKWATVSKRLNYILCIYLICLVISIVYGMSSKHPIETQANIA